MPQIKTRTTAIKQRQLLLLTALAASYFQVAAAARGLQALAEQKGSDGAAILTLDNKDTPEADQPLVSCAAGVIEWEWFGERWVPVQKRCRLTSTDHLAMACLANKKIAFLGDSHTRNAFRCFVEVASDRKEALSNGTLHATSTQLLHAYPVPSSADPAVCSEGSGMKCPPLYRLDYVWQTEGQELPPGVVPVPDNHTHALLCSNHHAVHNTDLHISLGHADGASTQLSFYWNPINSEGHAFNSQEELSYAGARQRDVLLRDLKAAGYDLVVTGALDFNAGQYTGYNHQALMQYFPHAAVMINHRMDLWSVQGAVDDFKKTQEHGIATVDFATNSTSYYYHLSDDELSLQARGVLIALRRYFCHRLPEISAASVHHTTG
ncbi:hypothetical protein WJX72_004181 [[Myrmecia] bisecta]|uniref:Uncharacterized protein n=1 Tax=[Myrmecia] bisecta TaxID=41462 RepID=A0AAW1PNS2_9CHLO